MAAAPTATSGPTIHTDRTKSPPDFRVEVRPLRRLAVEGRRTHVACQVIALSRGSATPSRQSVQPWMISRG